MLTGSANIIGDEVELSLTLSPVESGVAEWSWDATWPYEELATIRADVAREAALQLKTGLTGDQEARLSALADVDSEALDLYYQGSYWLRSAVSPRRGEEWPRLL